MKSLLKNNHGAALAEFAIVALPVLMFIIGIIQTAWVVWVDNVLYVSVDAASRCGAVSSSTLPCYGSGLANMQQTANLVFAPLRGAAFSNNANCTGAGLVGSYPVNIAYVVNLTLTAQSCYPTVVAPS
jgi:Flp pilus assembly protein TadG